MHRTGEHDVLGEVETYISISGTAEVIDGAEPLRRIWKDGLEQWFPGGPNGAMLSAIRIQIDSAEIWDHGKILAIDVGSGSRPSGS